MGTAVLVAYGVFEFTDSSTDGFLAWVIGTMLALWWVKIV
jgi:hypothetical protein